MGVEPTTVAWEATVLPLNYIRILSCVFIWALRRGKRCAKLLRSVYALVKPISLVLLWCSCSFIVMYVTRLPNANHVLVIRRMTH